MGRVFATLSEAALEIKRDLAKSPLVDSSRVQQFAVDSQAREAMCYDYTILEFPATKEDLLAEGIQRGFWEADEAGQIENWLKFEERARLLWRPGETTETLHPDLVKTVEGSEPAYTYTDRLFGAEEALVATLVQSPNTRRAFWPIFDRMDAIRAPRQTRIPCSLGYQVLIRQANGKQYLHLVYLERSCDFDRFWISDLWLARKFQESVTRTLRAVMDVELGSLTHMVVSLHSFINEEIY